MAAPALHFSVATPADVEQARREARRLAAAEGLNPADAERIALVVSELGMNLVRYASGGRISVAPISGPRGHGIEVESRDDGPGIEDVEWALQDGCSTGGGLGSGLPGSRRLMDDFELETGPGGTTIRVRKWVAGR